jgi:hypothetical protein
MPSDCINQKALSRPHRENRKSAFAPPPIVVAVAQFDVGARGADESHDEGKDRLGIDGT